MGIVFDFSTGKRRGAEDEETQQVAQEMMRLAKQLPEDQGGHHECLIEFNKALAAADIAFCFEHLDLIERVHPRVRMIETHVPPQRSAAGSTSVESHIAAIRFTSMADLCDQILENGEREWNAKPAYFIALVLVFRRRFAEMYERAGGPFRF